MLTTTAIISLIIEGNVPKFHHLEKIPMFWLDGSSILLIVLMTALFQTFCEYYSQKKVCKINNSFEKNKKVNYIKIYRKKLIFLNKCFAIREGIVVEILFPKILVGDVLFIQEGMEIPIDGIILESRNMLVDESIITGEIDLVSKSTFEEYKLNIQTINNTNFIVYSGSKVKSLTLKYFFYEILN